MPIAVGRKKSAREDVDPTKLDNAITLLTNQRDLIDSAGFGNLTNAQRDEAIRNVTHIMVQLLKAIRLGIIKSDIDS